MLGLFWSNAPNKTSSISQQGVWQSIDENTDVHFWLNNTRTVTISYHASVEGYRSSGTGMPLPREAKDFLQVRCLVDQVPHKSSGSYTSSFLVEPRKVGNVAGIFSLELQEGSHSVSLEWRKLGGGIRKWSTQASSDGGINTGFSLIVATDHERIWSLHDKKAATLMQSNVWTGLGDSLSLDISRKATVYFEYSLTVTPEMSSMFVKDRNQEFINTRLAINNVGYREGSLVHGAAAWNPSPSTLTGFMSVTLPPGTHNVRMQWKRTGTVFQSWSSQPSFLGGFAATRNIVASLEKVDLPRFSSHERAILRGDDHWHTVANKVLSFSLIKESAVHISYGLPVSQYGNPNFDANIWHRLNDIQARVMVDGIGYRYSAAMVSGTSRAMDSIYGSLALVLPSGSHTVALQWKTEQHDWTSLNALEDGFAQADQLLVLVSSENAKPVIRHPLNYRGDEDEDLVLAGLSISDIDDALVEGMRVKIQICVTHGLLRLPSIKEYTDEILVTDEYLRLSKAFEIEDTVTNINALLAKIVYVPIPDWFGSDELNISVSDLENVGSNGEKSASILVEIQIDNVDDPFTVDISQNLVVNEGGSLHVGAISIFDIDSQSSTFRVQLAAFCGLLSISSDVAGLHYLTFIYGDGSADTMLEMEAPYFVMQSVLANITYHSRTSCNRNQHMEALKLKVMDTSNYNFNVTAVINIEILPLNSGPEVQTLGMPRWTVSGIFVDHENADFESATFDYLHLSDNLNASVAIDIQNSESFSVNTITGVSSVSEAAVFYGEHSEVFAMHLDFSHNKLRSVAYNIIPAGMASNISLRSDVDLNLAAESVQCLIGNTYFPATFDDITRSASCEVIVSSSHYDRIVWMRLVGTPSDGSGDYSSNLLPLFIHQSPTIDMLLPFCLFQSSRSAIEMKVSNALTVEVCIFDSIVTAASVYGSTVICILPDFSELITPAEISVRVSRMDGAFLSDAITLSIVKDPEILDVSLFSWNGIFSLTLAGEWGHDVCNAMDTANPLCMFSVGKVRAPLIIGSSSVMCQIDVPLKDFFSFSLIRLPPLKSNSEYIVLLNTSIAGEVTEQYLVVEVQQAINQIAMSVSVECSADIEDCGSVTYSDTDSSIDAIITLSSVHVMNVSIVSPDWDYTVKAMLAADVEQATYVYTHYVLIYRLRLKTGSFITNLVSFEHDVHEVTHSGDVESSPSSVAGLQLSHADAISVFNGFFIRVYGGVFDLRSTLSCVFTMDNGDTSSSYAVIQSATEVTCMITVDHAASVSLRDEKSGGITNPISLQSESDSKYDSALWIAGGNNNAGDALYLKETEGEDLHVKSNLFSVESISPLISGLAGGGTLSVTGSGFANSVGLKESLMCQFGQVNVEAQYIADDSIQCTVPSSFVKGHQEFLVKLSDNSFRSEGHVFTFVSEVILTQSYPNLGSTEGGVPVIINGIFFPVASAISCIFGPKEVPGRTVDSTTVECISPPSDVGVVPLSLRLDGMIVTADLKFEYVLKSEIFSVEPSIGSADGGTNVTVRGSGFSLHREISCLFGNSEVMGVYLSDDIIRCVSPAHSTESVSLSLLLGDHMVVSAPSLFSFIVVPFLESIAPVQGSLSGGTVVTVTGHGFSAAIEFGTSCEFGEITGEATVISDSIVACIAPSVVEATEVIVTLNVMGLGLARGSATFNYIEDILLTGVSPRRGSTTGGTAVILSSVSLPVTSSVSCSFGDVVVSGVVLNVSSVECISPPSSSGTVAVHLLVDNVYAYEGTSFSYSYFDDKSLSTFSPSIGGTEGGTAVTVTGAGFTFHDDLSCRFGEIEVKGVFVSDTEIRCETPAHAAGVVSMVVSLGDDIYFTAPSEFSFVAVPVVEAVVPALGPLRGGTIVTISGHGFDEIGGDDVQCVFGDEIVTGAVISSEKVECATPAASDASPGQVRVSVTWNGDDSSRGSVIFTYADDIVLTGAYPQRGSTSGGATVIISSVYFPIASSVSCLFGMVSVPGRLLDSKSVECVSPSGLEGTVSLGVSLDGLGAESDNLQFTYIPETEVLSLDPSVGGTEGGTNVTITGTGFSVHDELSCVFDDLEVVGVYLSDNAILCVSPAHATDTVTVKVSLGDDMFVTVPSEFTFVPVPVVESISPSVGLLNGGTVVTVTGHGFEAIAGEDPLLQCIFGENSVDAKVIAESTIVCVTPSVSAPIEVVFSIGVSGIGSSRGSAKFTYVDDIILKAVSPSRGSTQGGALVTVLAVQFPLVTSVSCSFGNISSTGRIMDSTTVQCTVPPGKSGEVDISINVDGIEVTLDRFQFTYVNPADIYEVTPTVVSADGGTDVTVTGAGFTFHDDLSCLFDDSEVKGVFVSDTEIRCETPAHAAGVVSMVVSLGDDMYVTAPSEFSFVAVPVVEAVVPALGPLTGGTIVTISGHGFDEIGGDDVQCVFGNEIVTGAVISSEKVECATPAASDASPGQVRVSVTWNGDDSSRGSVIFTYADDIVLTGAYPQRGSTSGGATVIISSVYFPIASSVSCLFGMVSVPGRLLDSKSVECVSPSGLEGTVSLGVSLDGLGAESDNLQFTYIPETEVLSLDPSVGGTEGGTNVTITGTGFSVHDELSCVFDDLEVVGVYLSDNAILCVSPAHATDTVTVKVSLGDDMFVTVPSDFTFVPVPVVESISPSVGLLNGGTVVTVTGHGFEAIAGEDIFCVFGDSAVISSILSDSVLACTSPPCVECKFVDLSLSLSSSSLTTRVRSFEYVPQPVVFSASGTRNGDSYIISIFGNHFGSFNAYICTLEDLTDIEASFVSNHRIDCRFSASDVKAFSGSEQSVSLEIPNDKVLWSDSIYVGAEIVIHEVKIASHDRTSLQVTLEGYLFAEDAMYACLVDGSFSRAAIMPDGTLLCDVSKQDMASLAVLYIIDSGTDVWSPPYHLTDLSLKEEQEESADSLNSPNIASQIAEVGASNFEYHKTWFIHGNVNPPELGWADEVSFDSPVPQGQTSRDYSTALKKLHDFQGKDVSHCFLDSKTSCVGQSFAGTSTYITSLNERFSEQRISRVEVEFDPLVIDHVSSTAINPTNGSWVSVTGRSFSNSTKCQIDNVTVVSTIYFSSTSIQCFIPAAGEIEGYKSLNVLDIETGVISENVVDLYYDFFDIILDQQLRHMISANKPDVQKVTVMSDLESWCASSNGCKGGQNRSEIIDRSDMSSRFSGRYAWDANQNVHPLDWHSIDNNTEFDVNSSGLFYENEIYISDFEDGRQTAIGEVFLMEPEEVPFNSTISQLYFFGTYFAANVSWCCSVHESGYFYVTVVSPSEIQCPIFITLPPGLYEVDVLYDCSTVLNSFNISVQFLDEDRSMDIIDDAFVGGMHPAVSSMFPSSGSIRGGTAVTFDGENLQEVTVCKFESRNALHQLLERMVVNARDVSSDGKLGSRIECITNEFAAAGVMEVFLFHRNQTWISVDYQFNAYYPPLIDLSFQVKDTAAVANHDVAVFGMHFDDRLSVSCRVNFVDGSSSIILGRIMNSERIMCSDTSFWSNDVGDVFVSFNGIDFLDSHYHSEFSSFGFGRAKLDIPYDPEVSSRYLEASDSKEPEFDPFSTIELTTSQFRSIVCDGTQRLEITPSMMVSPLDRIICSFDSTTMHTTASITSLGTTVCDVPMMSPGTYLVTLMKSQQGFSQVELSRTEIRCAHRPIVTSAHVKKLSMVDGSHTFIFTGFHFLQNSLSLQCYLDDVFVVAMIQSTRIISCVFPPVAPSVKKIGVRVGDMTSVYEINACITEQILVHGGDVAETTAWRLAECDAMEEDATENSDGEVVSTNTVTKQGVTYWPRVTVTTGNTAIELIAEGITASHFYDCVFGDSEAVVPGHFIGLNRLLCYTPPMEPSRRTLYVNSSDSILWEFGDFWFVNPIKISEVTTSGVSRPGLVFIKLRVANISDIVEVAELYCHLGSEIIVAHIVSDVLITCQTEFSAAAKHVSLSLGSEVEVWSNSVSFSIDEFVYENVKVSPLLGTINGGTEVDVEIPTSYTLNLDSVQCSFNGIDAPHVSTRMSESLSSVICTSPAHLEGRVELLVWEPAFSDGDKSKNILASTVYTYQRPSDVAVAFPSHLMQGLSHEDGVISKVVYIQGTNFMDSPMLKCVVNESVWLPARWHAANMISCDIPRELTLAATPLSVRSSNNGFDKSNNEVLLQITPRQVATDVYPLKGYVLGGTILEVHLLDYFEGLSVYCQFSIHNVRAYRDDLGVYFCTTPPSDVGTQTLDIILDNAIIASYDFEFVGVPTVSGLSSYVLMSTFENTVTVMGEGFDSGTFGRFRRVDGTVKDGMCHVSFPTMMTCKVIPLGGESDIYLDISVNDGADYVSDFAVLRVIDQTQVVAASFPSVYRTGGGFVTFSVVHLHSLESTYCVFEERDVHMTQTSPITFSTNNEVSCSIPPFSSPIVDLFIEQNDFIIYGPSHIEVKVEPTVISVSPTSMQSGMFTVLSVEFSNSGDQPSQMDCVFDSMRYPLQMLSPHIGFCVVQPMNSGVYNLSLSHTHNLNGTIGVRDEIVVFDGPNDVSFNTTAVLSFTYNVVSIKSQSCSFPQSYCKQDDNSGKIPLLMSPCEIHCEIEPFTSHHANSTLLSLCTHGSEDFPFVTHVLDVYGAAVISSIYPPAGSTLGGTTVQIFGAGFENSGLLECLFDDVVVPAVYSSTSLLFCVTPPTEPRNVTVNILRDSRQVTSSALVYEFIALTPISAISTQDIFSIGGSVVDVTVTKMQSSVMYKYQCKFTDIVVNAVPIDTTTLRCITPALAFKTVEFSLVNNGAEVSSKFTLTVIQPPTVLLVEPMTVPSNIPVDFTVLLSDAIEIREGAMKCAVNGHAVTAQVVDTIVDCSIPDPGLSPGANTLVISIEGVEFYSVQILARTPIVVNRVTPRIGFAPQESTVRVYTVAPVERTSHAKCCFDFGDNTDVVLKQALLAGPNQWECFSPTIENNISRTAIIGMMGSDGICETTSFPYKFVPYPDVLSVEPVEGPLSGGTVVSIHLSKPLAAEIKVKCRIGEESFSTERPDSFTIQCVTRYSPAGVNFIELSVNGIDYLPIPDFNFEYKLLELEGVDVSSADDVPPFVYKLTPHIVSSSRPEEVTFFGTGFVLGSYCLMNNEYILESRYIGSTELACLTPINAPGQVQLKVVNPSTGLSSKSMELAFLSETARMVASVTGGIFPVRGPRTGGTAIFVSGSNFDKIDKSLLCRIGDDYVFASLVSSDQVKCITPSNSYSGLVDIKITTEDREVISGATSFEYVEDPILLDVQPHYGTVGTLVQVVGKGFTRNHDLECLFGDIVGETVVVSDSVLTCVVPLLSPEEYRVTVRTNGQQSVVSGLLFKFINYVVLDSLSPVNGPALRGNTMLTIHGHGFVESTDMRCVLGNEYLSVPAVFLSSEVVRCRLPSHKPGLVNISIVSEGTRLHSADNYLEFMYNPDVSVDKITPEFGYTSGGYPVFVFGSNFVNTTFLGCKFGDMKSRGIFLSNSSVICLAPSPLGRAALRSITVKVDVTINGVDYSENGIEFDYSEPCDEGWFCPGMSRQLCPNGTYCPINSRNFTLCPPGSFQPKEGQVNCASCPVGYICPDHGMPRPIICPAGQICDTQGLRASTKNCPMGHYCLNGTKSSSATAFQNNTRDNITDLWNVDYVTGVVIFNTSRINWDYVVWDAPAVGQSRIAHPPEASCDGMVCTPGTTGLIAEAPYPCPIGHYCRAGVGAQFPIPKNFSTPQRCFDGFFCPRGSINPEGKGPCPTGYFCPTQLDAIVCPRGHYCPGVGNRGPVECYPGTYNPSEARSNCTVCPTGHVCPGWGSLLPELCPAGFVCTALGLSYPVVLCPAGYLCKDGTLTLDPSDPTDKKPIPCESGTFCLGGVSREVNVAWIPSQPWGANTPQACSEGTYCKAGAFEPSGSGQCFQGHYCPPNLAFPIQTPIGNFAFEEGAVAPTLCFPGTYAPLKAQISCLPCPAGHGCASYGTYIPTICSPGTFRSVVDSVSCRLCLTGTYSDEWGAVDVSMCLPCPEGRVCGIQGIYTLADSTVCPAGYTCGYGTDRTRQFLHKAPAGYHTTQQTIPSDQFGSTCFAGFYCVRGTSTALALRAKCGVGYYCPEGTATAAGQEVKCPRTTTSLSGVDEINDCRIADVDVCDKAAYDLRYPMEDLMYYPNFEYTSIDGEDEQLVFDSSTTALNPTGEVVVTSRIYSINESTSSPLWVNDTVEVFRTCPSYGSAAYDVDNRIQIIGRNFRDSGQIYCRWRVCLSADEGKYPKRCRNRGKSSDDTDLPFAGEMEDGVKITLGKYISTTRVECDVPKYFFNEDEIAESLAGKCEFVDNDGFLRDNALEGNLSYIRTCADLLNCPNLPNEGQEYFQSLSFECSTSEILSGYCTHTPEFEHMFNPCYTQELLVEVANNARTYSGGDNLQGITINATVIPENLQTNVFKNHFIPPTFAEFTYVRESYWYEDDDILGMETDYCNIPRYAEEHPRERERGWFMMRANEVAHIHVDLKHIPDHLVYGEHYTFALYITPSRCTDEVCNSNRVRLAPQENVPCKQPKEFSEWFLDPSVKKNTANNITVYAMDDVLFKFEIQITLGLFATYGVHFQNTTTVRIASPHRSRVVSGIQHPVTRELSQYVSFEKQLVPVTFMFGCVYSREFSDSISMPLNLPPRGPDYERGRVIVSYNKSEDAVDIPDVLDTYSRIAVGPNFWDTLAATTTEAKEIYDAYFEVFHGMTHSDGVYEEAFTQFLSPHMLFFSNCRTFDSHIPLWLLLEGKECELPDEEDMGEDWRRFRYPALPDQDDVTVVGPWDFLQDPIADYCGRSLVCQYEEALDTLDVVPRWFEASSGDELFSVIREPISYFDLTGRPEGAAISEDDVGSGEAISNIIVSDVFKSVTVDREAANDIPGGCTLNCYPREMTLDMGYYQIEKNMKRLIYINLVYDSFDYDSDFTEYNLEIDYYPLGYFDLVVSFAFEAEIFVILFLFVGGVTVALAFIFWILVRIFTSLQNPPELRVFNMFFLIAPPPTAGITLAMCPIFAMTMAAYYLISGDRLEDEKAEVGSWYLDELQLEYIYIGARLDPNEQERARNGRLGICFIIIAFFCCFAGCLIFLPKKVSKREQEIALKRDKMAEKESIWAPTLWKRSNLMFCSILMGLFLVLIVEFSYWGDFGTYIWWNVLMLKVFAQFIDALVEYQLKELLLVTPISSALNITQGLITLGADDFVDFVLVYFVEMALLVVERVYVEPYLNFFLDWLEGAIEATISWIKSKMPKYLQKKAKIVPEVDYRKRDVDDDVGDDDAETVEPILDHYLNVCMDTLAMYYICFLIYLLMLFREEIVLPSLYGIAEQDMLYYLYFQIVIIFFLFIQDILLHSCCELFHGWKIYEYLVYTRYRFLQRETRWKGMETSLDECIDEGMRTLDQMCFSSQFFLMITIHCNGIMYIVLGMQMMLRAEYNPFADTAFAFILLYLIFCYIILVRFIMWFVLKIKLWKIKHENTSWHLQLDDEDDLDVPAWEDARGASHDAYLMNQRITSETFRYKFLNYNRAWLIQQLPSLLTPRTLRRSRPYLINQFARIINSRRDDISDDSDEDVKKKFGPVALSSSSRNIIRFWLDRARRRLKLKQIVEPLIRQARGAECEQCLSRKQLNIEYEIDLDQMIAMYDNLHPNETEVDQVEWKRFWRKNQRYHTICMVCVSKRKDDQRDKKRKKLGQYDDLDDLRQEDYPDWGPVFLSAASKAILLNWYRKAQKLRASKKGRREKKAPKPISDDEGDDIPRAFGKSVETTPATQAIAIKWMRTARARLQQKGGKGASALPSAQAIPLSNTFKKSGNKSKMRKK